MAVRRVFSIPPPVAIGAYFFVADSVIDKLGATRTRHLGRLLNVVGFAIAFTYPQLPVVVAGLALAGLGSSSLNPLLLRLPGD
jgi:hypothetical protein